MKSMNYSITIIGFIENFVNNSIHDVSLHLKVRHAANTIDENLIDHKKFRQYKDNFLFTRKGYCQYRKYLLLVDNIDKIKKDNFFVQEHNPPVTYMVTKLIDELKSNGKINKNKIIDIFSASEYEVIIISHNQSKILNSTRKLKENASAAERIAALNITRQNGLKKYEEWERRLSDLV